MQDGYPIIKTGKSLRIGDSIPGYGIIIHQRCGFTSWNCELDTGQVVCFGHKDRFLVTGNLLKNEAIIIRDYRERLKNIVNDQSGM